MAALDCLERARLLVEPALEAAVDRLCPDLRLPARYHFGWDEHNGSPAGVGAGKGLRPTLALLSAEAVGAPAEVGVPGAVAVELVHNFSLVHDDIIDGDTERRHRATVWSAFGVDDAVISGDALHTLAFQVLLDDPTPERVVATTRLVDATAAMIAGQAADMAFDDRLDVDLAACLAMEADKTGALLGYAASVGAVLAGADTTRVNALEAFGQEMGLAFQAVDDVLGIWGDEAVTGKESSDIATRKKTLPLIYGLQEATGADGERLAAILRTPIPGSTTTGIAPALKRAKIIVKNSREGFTINMVRTPFATPFFTRPAASRFDCSSNCSKVR